MAKIFICGGGFSPLFFALFAPLKLKKDKLQGAKMKMGNEVKQKAQELREKYRELSAAQLVNNFIYLSQNHLILALHFDKLLFYIHHYCYHYFLKFQYQYLNKK